MAAWLKPAQGPISSGFGKRPPPTPGASTFHAGVDIGANNGSPVIASASGVVAFAGLAGGFGGFVRIDHPGPDETYYAHLSYIGVRYGQQVVQGQVIAASGGRKGQWGAGTSNGSHLHTEHRINGKAVDPVPYWATSAAGNGSTPITPEEEADQDMYIIRSIKDDLGTNIIPNGVYLVTPHGVTGVTATTQSVVNRLNGKASTFAVDLYSSEVAQIDERLRTAARSSSTTPAATVDIAALATALAPLLNDDATVDVDVLATKLTTALAPQFAVVNANIDDQPTEFTIAPKVG